MRFTPYGPPARRTVKMPSSTKELVQTHLINFFVFAVTTHLLIGVQHHASGAGQSRDLPPCPRQRGRRAGRQYYDISWGDRIYGVGSLWTQGLSSE